MKKAFLLSFLAISTLLVGCGGDPISSSTAHDSISSNESSSSDSSSSSTSIDEAEELEAAIASISQAYKARIEMNMVSSIYSDSLATYQMIQVEGTRSYYEESLEDGGEPTFSNAYQFVDEEGNLYYESLDYTNTVVKTSTGISFETLTQADPFLHLDATYFTYEKEGVYKVSPEAVLLIFGEVLSQFIDLLDENISATIGVENGKFASFEAILGSNDYLSIEIDVRFDGSGLDCYTPVHKTPKEDDGTDKSKLISAFSRIGNASSYTQTISTYASGELTTTYYLFGGDSVLVSEHGPYSGENGGDSRYQEGDIYFAYASEGDTSLTRYTYDVSSQRFIEATDIDSGYLIPMSYEEFLDEGHLVAPAFYSGIHDGWLIYGSEYIELCYPAYFPGYPRNRKSNECLSLSLRLGSGDLPSITLSYKDGTFQTITYSSLDSTDLSGVPLA